MTIAGRYYSSVKDMMRDLMAELWAECALAPPDQLDDTEVDDAFIHWRWQQEQDECGREQLDLCRPRGRTSRAAKFVSFFLATDAWFLEREHLLWQQEQDSCDRDQLDLSRKENHSQ